MTGGFGNNLIDEIEITKESEKSVWVKTQWRDKETITQERKRSDWHNFFDTFDEAKNFLIEKSENRIKAYESNLNDEKSFLEKIKSFVFPEIK
jgi:hypothetical protein